jgi:hypothetical protein
MFASQVTDSAAALRLVRLGVQVSEWICLPAAGEVPGCAQSPRGLFKLKT